MSDETDAPPLGEDVQRAINENPEAVEDYHAGEGGALTFLVGQVLHIRGGRGDPSQIRNELTERMDEGGDDDE